MHTYANTIKNYCASVTLIETCNNKNSDFQFLIVPKQGASISFKFDHKTSSTLARQIESICSAELEEHGNATSMEQTTPQKQKGETQ